MLALRQSLKRVLSSSAGPSSPLSSPASWHRQSYLAHRFSRTLSSTSPKLYDASSNKPPNEGASSPSSLPAAQKEVTFETAEPRLSLTFTCTVPACNTRSTHQFTKRSYQKGIVIVECPGCKNRHLIADHLGWFKESTEEGKLKTVEDLMRAKGEKVRRGVLGAGGIIEYAPE
ncbi:zf-DNL-domain-containing protein [Wolfiporia cocos MD-104 SS10]|uniref:Zf-DNL-domain-containing protein n=1 Tax=Wolfiporia cocos (strain MD-104) TaxID=742152 RepID=A0A2H3JQM7_WOLCO|nr:zf-DNL-domain-containing protein [Wolfiporia cocos MD-104 SS10]